MPGASQSGEAENARIMLGLLDSVEREGAKSQRRLAAELGIALGLVNAYLKRCVKKGLVKVRQAPARSYAYYITPQGFSEKSRLTVEYLSSSFSFFRQAKGECSELFRAAKENGVQTVVLVGQSDLAEIAALCAIEHSVDIVGVVEAQRTSGQFIGFPVFARLDEIPRSFDAALITSVRNARQVYEDTVAQCGDRRVLVPQLLRISQPKQNGMPT